MDPITIVADFPHTSPEELFDFWTNPELLKKWWPPETELNPTTGGSYHFSWPKQKWHLRGKFTEFNKGKELGFTWQWDHESIDQTQVRLTFEPMSGDSGTRLILHHGNYADNAEGKKIREDHAEGWVYFLGRLQEELGHFVSQRGRARC